MDEKLLAEKYQEWIRKSRREKKRLGGSFEAYVSLFIEKPPKTEKKDQNL